MIQPLEETHEVFTGFQKDQIDTVFPVVQRNQSVFDFALELVKQEEESKRRFAVEVVSGAFPAEMYEMVLRSGFHTFSSKQTIEMRRVCKSWKKLLDMLIMTQVRLAFLLCCQAEYAHDLEFCSVNNSSIEEDLEPLHYSYLSLKQFNVMVNLGATHLLSKRLYGARFYKCCEPNVDGSHSKLCTSRSEVHLRSVLLWIFFAGHYYVVVPFLGRYNEHVTFGDVDSLIREVVKNSNEKALLEYIITHRNEDCKIWWKGRLESLFETVRRDGYAPLERLHWCFEVYKVFWRYAPWKTRKVIRKLLTDFGSYIYDASKQKVVNRLVDEVIEETDMTDRSKRARREFETTEKRSQKKSRQ